ncbi:MAG: ABC transporter ATP-binding protein [Anaerolineae bacterium]|nr:ABC transporter ATP-binding protein [Anaerolineae bacterium]
MENNEDIVLSVENLHTYFHTTLGTVRALNGVSYSVPQGKVLGIVGESGCGKSVTSLAVMQLVPPPGVIEQGKITFKAARRGNGGWVDITALGRHSPEMHEIRGDEISMIFQEPMTSLNPVFTIGDQISEAVLLHQGVDRAEGRRRAIDILTRVNMPNPERIVDNYPHELSGGMRQRAMIAMALSCTPTMLIADEPTTALDVTTEAQILDLMRELQADLGMSIMFITHNLGVIAQMADEVAVMYLGCIVERAPVDDIFFDTKHPYTSALLQSIPHVGSRTQERLASIRGMVPDPYSVVPGCPFHPRCDAYRDKAELKGVCDGDMPEITAIGPRHYVRCYLYQ